MTVLLYVAGALFIALTVYAVYLTFEAAAWGRTAASARLVERLLQTGTRICPRCMGSGRIGGKTCPRCLGEGIIGK